ncbi:DNA repair protein RecO, partial [Epulopiscium sp. SCG-B10WGA-EpuloA2]
MILNTRAIIIKEFTVGEGDKYISLFSDKFGQINVSAKRANHYTRGFTAGTQLFVYGIFNIKKTRDTYKLLNIEIIKTFHKLRNDIVALSYASFIAEFLNEVTKENSSNKNLLTLTLYTLHEITKNKLSPKLIRFVFEMRAMRYLGFMPNVITCTNCEKDLQTIDIQKKYIFSIENGGLICDECNIKGLRLSVGTIYAFRYILNAPLKELYHFSIISNLALEFCSISEK